MPVQRDPNSGKALRNPATGRLIRWRADVPCCCTGELPEPPAEPEDPGTPPDRDETDPTGGGGCACFVQYAAILLTVTGIVNCSPQRRSYNCAPGSSVDAVITLNDIPMGSWLVPVTYDPADSQVGYTNKDVILLTSPNAVEVRSTNGDLYSRGGLRLRLVGATVRACSDKRITGVVNIETTDVIVQDRDAMNNQRADFGVNCADANGSPDGRFNSVPIGSFTVDCTVTCAEPLTCTDARTPTTCPDPPNTMDGQLTAGGSMTMTAVA